MQRCGLQKDAGTEPGLSSGAVLCGAALEVAGEEAELSSEAVLQCGEIAGELLEAVLHCGEAVLQSNVGTVQTEQLILPGHFSSFFQKNFHFSKKNSVQTKFSQVSKNILSVRLWSLHSKNLSKSKPPPLKDPKRLSMSKIQKHSPFWCRPKIGPKSAFFGDHPRGYL